ncbi:unnamed protein product [Nezara viridula]|uniref:Fatty acid synthase n=1 Tax=Nezara viridula TaxID=85310 RepID=A0A9P0HCL3_NEZVI|nr:unnamed protein product [Nezara viridula]
MDDEFMALIHEINKINIPGHNYRGYMILEEEPYQEITELKNPDGRELWYVFSGMGSQWTGMGKGLMALEPFAKAIYKCTVALQEEGVDLMQIINSSQPDTFDNILNSFIAIAAVQIGLVDVLKALGLTPDGIVGHSVGELGCAYADGAFTAEQTILAAYWRGKSISESNLKPGCMAAIGLSWEEINERLPEGIVAACHNSGDNVTISAPAELLDPFLEKLSVEGIFNRKVNSSGFAFHSKYIADAGPQLRANLEKIIPIPKPRTKRWISTSIPESAWSSELASSSSAAYHVNNLLSPVLFHEGVSHIPDGALVIEIAPHSLLQAVLKRSLPNCSVIGLVKKDVPDDVGNFLRNVGKIHNEGVALDLKCLYPRIAYPVGRGTPMISPMLKWDHSIEWQVPLFAKQTSKSGECVIEIDINKENDSFIVGHTIDGRVLFPATGYLTLIWKTFAKVQGTQMEETPIILENVQFHRATIMPKEGSVKFAISIFDGSGQFELCEGGSTVVTGTVRSMENWHGLAMKISSSESKIQLTSEDIYKELRLRGYEYGGFFKGIKKSDIDGTNGELNWGGNWISFMDTMLQFSLVGRTSRELALPTRILQVTIDPRKHLQFAENSVDIPVQYEKDIDVIQSGGIEIRNLKVSLAPRRQQTQAPPKLEKYIFLPYFKDGIKKEDGLAAALQIVLENSGGALKLKIMELGGGESEEPLAPLISELLSSEPQITAEISFVTLRPEQYADLENYNVNVVKKNYAEAVDSNLHLLVCKSALSFNGLPSVVNSLKPGAFLLVEDRQEINYGNMVVISKFSSDGKGLLLLRKATKYIQPKVIKITNHNYSWVETVKKGLKDCENGAKVLLINEGEATSGIIGMINCLKQEPGGNNLRSVFIQDPKSKEFSLTSTPYALQLKKDLLQNVLSPDGDWGSFRHLRIPNQDETVTQTEHAFVNAVTRGDLSSLRWIQAPASPAGKETNGVGLCTVYYAPLNFRDIMLASGKLPPDALPGDLAGQECVLGLEFAGRNSRGERVMGIVEAKGLAMSVTCDPLFTWPVPDSWSLQQAATVPIVFATAYYSLIVRGGMKPGESILIHAGTGGVGQAAIHIALHMGCKVFTTVGTQQKREFIKTNFPKLDDRCIGNSRDTSFEQLILSETKGRGVDLVLNSLAEDKLQASVRCLAQGGRFLEIGKLDLSNNSPLGMSILLKNTTVHGILLDALMGKGSHNLEKVEVAKLMREGIKSGAVKPLPHTTFNRDELEQSFRFMATGKHIGKVLLKIRDEEPIKKSLPKKEIINAIPRTYMNQEKSYVLIGGLGGFGLELANWLITRGATKIVLVSRSGVTNGFQFLCIKRWEQKGVKVLVSKTDCTCLDGAKSLIKEAEKLGPVGGIFNLAAVLRDAFMENQTEEDFRAVCRAKVDATAALDLISRSCKQLEHFVTFSSVSCGRGNPGQSNYGFANSVMERICESRRVLGLPGTAIQWGAVGDVGLVMDSMKGGNETVVGGTLPQRITSCLSTLDYFLQLQDPVLASMVLAEKGKVGQDPGQASLVNAIANILGLKDPDNCGSKSLAELGMDSLMGSEIKQILERNYDLVLSAQEIRNLTFPTLKNLSSGGSQDTSSEKQNGVVYKNILPMEAVIKLQTKSKTDTSMPIFFIHPIEGVIDMLNEVASHVQMTVFGLQCVKNAPLASIEQLAAYYLQHITSLQKNGPYLIVGYSFGAGVAFEIGLQLESSGQKVTLVLIDGSPSFVRNHINNYKETKGLDKDFDAFRLSYIAMLFSNQDFAQVQKEMLVLDTWNSRLKRCAEIMSNFSEEEIQEGASSFGKKLNAAYVYEPRFKFNGEIILLKAAESFVDLGEDYDLKKHCNQKVKVKIVPGDHQKVLVGNSAKLIANTVNKYAEVFSK